MTKKIFRSGFLTIILVLFISVVMIFGVLFEQFENQIENELKSEADYISYAVEKVGESVIYDFKDADKRITLIDENGVVIADTRADAAALDNHSDRKEIIDAKKYGFGTSSRYSDTLTEKTIYCAVKTKNGKILRISATQSTVVAMLIKLIRPLALIVAAALLLSYILSKKVSKSIVKPINELDLDNPANNVAYEELTPLLKKISVQKKTIDRQIRDARQKQEEFRLITENMSEGLVIIDKNAKVLSYNNAAVKLLEIDSDNIDSALDINRKKGFRQAVEKALSGERSQSDIVSDLKSYDLIATPVMEEDKVIGAVIVIVDVTEREKREQLRREFTSNVSHELRTPLTSISGFAEMLKAGDVDKDTALDFAGSIYDEAQRLISLVNDIMRLSELDEKSAQIKKENVNLTKLCEKITQRLKPYADKKNVEIVCSGDDAVIQGSEKILEEMVYNLCDNAVKYNIDGGKVNVRVEKGEKNVSLSVSDTGIGIPKADINRVFERFYRVDKSHSKAVGGTGLGLSIVKHGAMYHDAQIKIDSREGKGTTVTVIF